MAAAGHCRRCCGVGGRATGLRGCWLSFTVAAIPCHRTSCAFQGAIPPTADTQAPRLPPDCFRSNLPPYRDHPVARNRCLLYPRKPTFSWTSLTSGCDPKQPFIGDVSAGRCYDTAVNAAKEKPRSRRGQVRRQVAPPPMGLPPRNSHSFWPYERRLHCGYLLPL